eukprot:2418207-Pleurochrysis_carterae.AAC.4
MGAEYAHGKLDLFIGAVLCFAESGAQMRTDVVLSRHAVPHIVCGSSFPVNQSACMHNSPMPFPTNGSPPTFPRTSRALHQSLRTPR